MILSLAPMEGLTGEVFRRVHALCFGALDRYYTPFLTPPKVGHPFVGTRLAEIDPEANKGFDVIPQLLSKDADEFVWATKLLSDMGYREVNLNLGCPSGTVTGKGKGAGFLRDLSGLERFLDAVCERSSLPVSVKTRLGMNDDTEYEKILELYCRFSLAELILHPRLKKDRYQGVPRRQAYGVTLDRAPFPVAYNGDVFSLGDLADLRDAYPGTRHVMLGRGILANPALVRMHRGGKAADLAELRRFHDLLYQENEAAVGPKAVFRMKEWWHYAQFAFADPARALLAVREVRDPAAYATAVEAVFGSIPLASEPRYGR